MGLNVLLGPGFGTTPGTGSEGLKKKLQHGGVL